MNGVVVAVHRVDDSILNSKAGKHTLYKSQIDAKPSKRANRISLKESFAQSINPVFGKLGVQQLGPEILGSYAEAFGFNQEIDFELPIRPSRIELSGQAFEMAEVASGFNRTTRISPLHGAVMAAAIVNRGRWVEPTVVDWIAHDKNQIIYQAQTVFGEQVIEPETAAVLRELMQATVQSGTAHKEFQKHHDDKILSRLEIGGKTGSMGDGSGGTHYDWFVGYAREPRGRERLRILRGGRPRGLYRHPRRRLCRRGHSGVLQRLLCPAGIPAGIRANASPAKTPK